MVNLRLTYFRTILAETARFWQSDRFTDARRVRAIGKDAGTDRTAAYVKRWQGAATFTGRAI